MGDVDSSRPGPLLAFLAVYDPLDPVDGLQDILEHGDFAEDHGRHVCIVATECVDHCAGRSDCERAGNGGTEIVVRPVEEHPRVPHAVAAKFRMRQRGLAAVRAD